MTLPHTPNATSPHDGRSVVIVGAGVIGASIAHRLARAGHPVLVLDASEPGSAVTSASFAWIGLSKSDASAHQEPLRARARSEFDRVLSELAATPAAEGSGSLANDLEFRANGALSWEESDEFTRRFVSEHQAAGHPVELLGREEALAVEPGLLHAPVVAAHSSGDAGIDPVALTRALLASAEAHGGEVRTGITAIGIATADGAVTGVDTTEGRIPASAVVLAAGTGAPALAASAGVDIALTPGPCALLTFKVDEPLVRGILSTPELEIRQLNDTTLIAAEDVPEGFDSDPAELAGPVLEAIRRGVAGGQGIRLAGAVIADRPMPASGLPLVGESAEISGLHLAIAHPGIILSAAIAQRIADGLPVR